MKLFSNNASFLKLKVLVLNDKSNYRITVQHVEKKNGMDVHWIVLLVLMMSLLVVASVAFGILMFFVIRSMRNFRRLQRQAMLPRERRYAHSEYFIDKTLRNMQIGKFDEMKEQNYYEETRCVICLEEFENKTRVHITNECAHVFHGECLKPWFENM